MPEKINKLKGYRVMIGKTQEEMAEAIGISKRAYQDKEAGVSSLTLSEAVRVIEIFKGFGINITAEELQ